MGRNSGGSKHRKKKSTHEISQGALPTGQAPVASPAARRLAADHGLSLNGIAGSGPTGRILVADVQQALALKAGGGTAEAAAETASDGQVGGGSRCREVKIRRIMARKMTESWQTIPHFYVTYSVDMTDIIRFRKDLGVTINDFVLAAVVRSLQEHPWVNSWWVDGEAVEKETINIAVAIATDRGLYTPVVRNCAGMSLQDISLSARELGRRAHGGQLSSADMDGGTFTVSNMGMLGVESFRAIITPPQAAVLAIGTVRGEVIVDEAGEPAVAPVMRMTLAADHRILDGADAAEFMATLKCYLEAPVTLISHLNS